MASRKERDEKYQRYLRQLDSPEWLRDEDLQMENIRRQAAMDRLGAQGGMLYGPPVPQSVMERNQPNPWKRINDRSEKSDLGLDVSNLLLDIQATGNPSPYGPNMEFRTPLYKRGLEPIPQDQLLEFWYGPRFSENRDFFQNYLNPKEAERIKGNIRPNNNPYTNVMKGGGNE